MTKSRPFASPFSAPLAALLALTLPLAACDKPDEAALARTDAAFKGQQVDGQVQPVAARAVTVGQGGRQAGACPATARARTGKLAVRWSNSEAGPIKAEVEGDVWVCQADGDWSGVIFPAFGQETDDCMVSAPASGAREYQGPCRWGWVRTADLAVAARR
jgi:hypothetical protein